MKSHDLLPTGPVYLKVAALLPSFCVLLVLNIFFGPVRDWASESVTIFTGLFGRSDIVIQLFAGLFGVILGLLIILPFGWVLFRAFAAGKIPLAVTVLAVLVDTAWGRPLLSYFAAVLYLGPLCFRGEYMPRLLVVLLALVPLMPIAGYRTSSRWAALAVAAVLFVYFVARAAGLLFTYRSFRTGMLNFGLNPFSFGPSEFHHPREAVLYCFHFLTIGLYAWGQLSELFGLRMAALCYAPLAFITGSCLLETPFLLAGRDVRQLPAPMPPPFVPFGLLESPTELSFVRSKFSPKLGWDRLVELLSRSAYALPVEDDEPAREASHLFVGHSLDGVPIILDRAILGGHMHILGSSGSGKTTSASCRSSSS
jgi:hypothetical protein